MSKAANWKEKAQGIVVKGAKGVAVGAKYTWLTLVPRIVVFGAHVIFALLQFINLAERVCNEYQLQSEAKLRGATIEPTVSFYEKKKDIDNFVPANVESDDSESVAVA